MSKKAKKKTKAVRFKPISVESVNRQLELDEAKKLSENRLDEINRLSEEIKDLKNREEVNVLRISDLEGSICVAEKEAIAQKEALDFANERLRKIATSNFGICKNAKGEVVLLYAPEFTQFLAVQKVADLSLYEAAMQIGDPEIRSKATEAIGKANMERNEVALSKMKDRVIQILQNQKKGN